MKPDKLNDILDGLDPELVEAAAEARTQNKIKKPWLKWAVTAACFAFAALTVFGVIRSTRKPVIGNTGADTKTNSSFSAATSTVSPTEENKDTDKTRSGMNNTPAKVGNLSINAQYPSVVPRPDENDYWGSDGSFRSEAFDLAFSKWEEYYHSRTRLPENYLSDMSGFYRKIIQSIIPDESGKNCTLSPSNIYMCLSMLAEVTDGDSKAQILKLMGADSLEQLRSQTKAVWESTYENENRGTIIMANSFWLSDSFKYNEKPLYILQKNYYASSFSGKMGSDDFNKKLQNWIDLQTGGLLTEQAKAVETSPDTVLALVSTIYFKGQWSNKFMKEMTKSGTFHGADGDAECNFMNQSESGMPYYKRDNFSAVKKSFMDGSAMYLILPDKGTTPEALVRNGKVLDFVMQGNSNLSSQKYPPQYPLVNLSMPKFDVTSSINLLDRFSDMGVTDINNFKPITDDAVSLSEAKHAARVTVDEDGCRAAAFTEMLCGEGMPNDRVDFTLDRPFIFAITSPDGLPLFFGTVNSMK